MLIEHKPRDRWFEGMQGQHCSVRAAYNARVKGPESHANIRFIRYTHMAVARKTIKTNWKDIGDLRLPNPAWRIGKAAKWFEERLGLPMGIITFRNPDGSKARVDKSLRALRRDWDSKGRRQER